MIKSAVSDGGEDQGAEVAFMGPRERLLVSFGKEPSRARGSSFQCDRRVVTDELGGSFCRRPLSFVVIIPEQKDKSGWTRVSKNQYLTHHLLLVAGAFCRAASLESRVFVSEAKAHSHCPTQNDID